MGGGIDAGGGIFRRAAEATYTPQRDPSRCPVVADFADATSWARPIERGVRIFGTRKIPRFPYTAFGLNHLLVASEAVARMEPCRRATSHQDLDLAARDSGSRQCFQRAAESGESPSFSSRPRYGQPAFTDWWNSVRAWCWSS